MNRVRRNKEQFYRLREAPASGRWLRWDGHSLTDIERCGWFGNERGLTAIQSESAVARDLVGVPVDLAPMYDDGVRP